MQSPSDENKQFADAVSHELRSPLRSIENLAQWTIDDGGDNLPEQCRQNLEKILARVQRLATLQNDLLEYYKASYSDYPVELVNIETLIQETLQTLGSEKHFPVTFTGHAESVNTHTTPLRQVLSNLLDNAIKHHDRSSGNIGIHVRHTGSSLVISVLDDGPGIEPQHQQSIFEPFIRLQSQADAEGSGLGLAMARKLTGRYQGNIDVKSNPGSQRGSRFEFEWPVYTS